MELCYINNEFVSPEQALLPVSDLVIQRGVGVFEAFGTIDGRPLMMTAHLERLLQSAQCANIHARLELDRVKEIIRKGVARVRRNLNHEVSVKVYLTGGDIFDGQRGFIAPRLLVIFEKLLLPPRSAYENGVTLEPLPFGRKDPTVKSVDYRAAYTNANTSAGASAFEVLYCPDGEITEAGHSSFFLVVKERTGYINLVTAPLPRVLAGTTRRAILDLARDFARGENINLNIQERCPLVSELPHASEAFITGSTKQVVPVIKIGDVTIGDGRPGPITKQLADLYKAHIQALLE